MLYRQNQILGSELETTRSNLAEAIRLGRLAVAVSRSQSSLAPAMASSHFNSTVPNGFSDVGARRNEACTSSQGASSSSGDTKSASHPWPDSDSDSDSKSYHTASEDDTHVPSPMTDTHTPPLSPEPYDSLVGTNESLVSPTSFTAGSSDAHHTELSSGPVSCSTSDGGNPKLGFSTILTVCNQQPTSL